MQDKLRIGLALGSGSARGWSHIGVIRALEEAGIVPDVIAGTSVGAVVGAVYAAGELDRFETWIRGVTWQKVVGMLDLRMGGGLIEGSRLVDFFRARFDDPGIEHLPRTFACVATDLANGREVWLRDGPVIDAVRASIALPGLFTPAWLDGRLLVDGGLVNPVPVSLCRALGADFVIAVDLNWNLVTRRSHVQGEIRPDQREALEAAVEAAQPAPQRGLLEGVLARFVPAGWRNGASSARVAGALPSMLDVLTSSLNIMQVRITESRLAGEPADAMIRPRLADVTAMDYHRAAYSIAEGRRAAGQALSQIHEQLAACR
ncbi:MAG: patatin-like phospholipase family protein [Candidatus Dactylopiibacterium sp.]|nr:patatin-like phospholipase family protein [Candidatus Dactylopiibacterium sp.]